MCSASFPFALALSPSQADAPFMGEPNLRSAFEGRGNTRCMIARRANYRIDCYRFFLYDPRRTGFTKTCQRLGGLAVTECSGIAANTVMLAPRYRRRLL